MLLSDCPGIPSLCLFCDVTLVYFFVPALLYSRSPLHTLFFLFHLELSEGRAPCCFSLVLHFAPKHHALHLLGFPEMGDELEDTSVHAS